MQEDPRPPDADVTQTSGSAGDAAGSIGPYRLLERLGAGGMGEVWLAEQIRPVRRQVALKVIKAGMDTAMVIARFEAERQALALMDHPAIAKVFDAGSTAEGRPYFAMEYVRGESLTAYCDYRRLSIPDRLDLFAHICEGVQHAHQKGIIHRDLKPSNLLVTVQDDRAVPKIIDFGVAKATSHHSLTERTLFTSLGGFVGTLEYMSPEQSGMGALDIDTRTDVYALGVVLYELLTGVLPFDRQVFQARALDEIQRTIREVDPPKPSTRISQQHGAASQAAASRSAEPSTLARTLRGDLDWITMKALEKDRSRRYESASELASDVRRHMRSEPVLARPATAAYRAGRFVRRHRFGVAAAAAIILLLLSSTIVMAVQARRIARERDRANSEAETAKQIAAFLVGLFDVVKPSEATANSITARQILDKGADRIRRDLTPRSATRGTLLATMGDVYNSVGLYESAESLLEESLEDRTAVFGGRSAEAADGLFQIARVLRTRGKLADAERHARSALDIRRELFGMEHPEVASSLSQVGGLVADKGDYTGGVAMLRDALRMQRLTPPPDIRMATTLRHLAYVLFERGDFEEAEQLSQEAMKLYTTLLGSGHPEALAQAYNVASTMMMRGRYAEAEAAYRTNLTETARTLGEEHPHMSAFWLNIGAAQYFQKKYAEAEVSYRQSLAIARKAFAGDHNDVADALTNLGEAINAQGRHAAAEALLIESTDMRRRLLGDDHPQLVVGLTFLAKMQLASGKVVEGEATARRAVKIAREKFGPQQHRTQEAEGALGAILVTRKKWAEAEPLLLRYRAALEANTVVDGDLREVTQQIIGMYDSWGKPSEAAKWRAVLAQTPDPPR